MSERRSGGLFVPGEVESYAMGDAGAKRVVVAMSGGVDSSVAAALLVRAGYHVHGLMLRLWSEPAGCLEGCPGSQAANRCCTPDQVADAQRVADILGIPFDTLDAVLLFRSTVVQDFIDTYSAGLTPNPCVVCNRWIRFGFLLEHAKAIGAQYLATGHYVRVEQVDGGYQLLRGVDEAKDQSYVLYMLNQFHLAHLLFPVGGYSKTQIRDLAHEWGLPVADKADSQDLCFLADGDYRRFLRQHAPEAVRPGPIEDLEGRKLGEHRGLNAYTIGQRRGLGISAPQPLYVAGIDPARNAILVGPKDAARRRQLVTKNTEWVAGRPPAGGRPNEVEVRIRYHARPQPATVTPGPGGRATVRFASALSDVAPGQAAVFYWGEVCLGGGTISPLEAVA